MFFVCHSRKSYICSLYTIGRLTPKSTIAFFVPARHLYRASSPLTQYGVPGTNSRGAFYFPKHPVLFILLLVLTPALWIAFVATTNPHEMFVGVFASAATIVFTVFVCRSSSTNLQLRPRDLLQLWRIPWYLLQDTWVILRVFAKDLLHLQPAGDHYRVCGFDAGTHDPVRVARMVLAVASTTATPNSIVLGIDAAQSRMLFHQVEPTPVTRMAKALGAKA